MTKVKSDSGADTSVGDFEAPVEQTSDTSVLGTSDPAVEAFVRGNNLEKWLGVVLHLVSRHFVAIGGVMLRKQEDPELPEEWVNIRVVASGDTDSILDAYDAFTLETASVLPSDVSRKIRLSVGVA